MKHSLKWLSGLLLVVGLSQVSAGTLEEVRERGVLRCGVNGELPGLSFKDAAGHWSGIDRLLPGGGRRRAWPCGEGRVRST